MNRRKQDPMEEVLEDVAQELGVGLEERAKPGQGGVGWRSAFLPTMLSLVAVALGVLALLVSFLGSGGGPPSAEWEEMKRQQATLADRLSRVEDRFKGSEKSVAGSSEIKKIQRKVSSLSKRLAALERAKGSGRGALRTRPPKGKVHIVRRGESLYLIAKRYDLRLEDLLRMNGLTVKSVIRPGQRLVVSK